MQIKKIDELSKIVPLLTYQRVNDEQNIVVSPKKLLFSLTCLKNHISYQYKLLTSVAGVDF